MTTEANAAEAPANASERSLNSQTLFQAQHQLNNQ